MFEYKVVRNEKLIPCQGLQILSLPIDEFHPRLHSIEDYQVDPSLEPFGGSLPTAIFDLSPRDGFCFILSHKNEAALRGASNGLAGAHRTDLWCPWSPEASVFAGIDTTAAVLVAPIAYTCPRRKTFKSAHIQISEDFHLVREICFYQNPLKRSARFHLYANLPIDSSVSTLHSQLPVSIGFLYLE